VGHITAEFRTDTWYEFKRARSFSGERRVLESFISNLADDDIVWDVGANIGIYTCFAAKKLSAGTAIGFEPVPVNRARLEENLRANAPKSSWQTTTDSLWNANETLSLAFDHPESNRLDAGAGHHYLTDTDGWTSVECHRGDELVTEGMQVPDVMKIDVQGAELQVLSGMGDVLDGVREIYLEIHREKSGRYDTSADTIEALLREEGYELSYFGEPDMYRHGVYHVLAHRPEANTTVTETAETGR